LPAKGDEVKTLLGWLSFRGRTNRSRFWQMMVYFWGVLIWFGGLSVALTSNPIAVGLLGLAMLPIVLFMVVALLANSVRRLHDRGKTAWWLLVFNVLPAVFAFPSEVMRTEGAPAEAQAFFALVGLLGLPFSIWGFVEMGCLRGTTGPNKYGDDPLQPLQEVFA
jgi:uncharacterized membrane protein YhaH (DUF805 family)